MTTGAFQKRFLPILVLLAPALSGCQTVAAEIAAVSPNCPQLVVLDGKATFLKYYEISEEESRGFGITGWRSGQTYRVEIKRVLVGSVATPTVEVSLIAHGELNDASHRMLLEKEGEGRYGMIQTLDRDFGEDFREICEQYAPSG